MGSSFARIANSRSCNRNISFQVRIYLRSHGDVARVCLWHTVFSNGHVCFPAAIASDSLDCTPETANVGGVSTSPESSNTRLCGHIISSLEQYYLMCALYLLLWLITEDCQIQLSPSFPFGGPSPLSPSPPQKKTDVNLFGYFLFPSYCSGKFWCNPALLSVNLDSILNGFGVLLVSAAFLTPSKRKDRKTTLVQQIAKYLIVPEDSTSGIFRKVAIVGRLRSKSGSQSSTASSWKQQITIDNGENERATNTTYTCNVWRNIRQNRHNQYIIISRNRSEHKMTMFVKINQ